MLLAMFCGETSGPTVYADVTLTPLQEFSQPYILHTCIQVIIVKTVHVTCFILFKRIAFRFASTYQFKDNVGCGLPSVVKKMKEL